MRRERGARPCPRPPCLRALAWAALASVQALAAEPRKPPVQVRVDRCPDVLLADVQRVVAVELGALLVNEVPGGEPATRVAIQCTEEQVLVVVEDPLTRKQLRRQDPLPADSAARARFIGLSAAELVAASWYELVAEPHPQRPPSVALPPPPLALPALAAREAVAPRLAPRPGAPWASLGVLVQVFPRGHPLSLLGGELGAGLPLGGRWSVGVHAAAVRGTASRASGQVVVDGFSGGSTLLMQTLEGPVRLWFELGGQLGFARLAGRSARPGLVGVEQLSPTAGPLLGLRLDTGAPLAGGAWLRVGYLTLGARGTATAEAPVDVHGWFLSAGLSATWRG